MNSNYSKTETISPDGFFKRMGKAVGGVVFGVILFLAAFPLLRWGENRQNLAEFVEKAKTVAADSIPAETGLIRVSGVITSSESVNDPVFLNPITGKKFLRLSRTAQMYAWKEDKKSETNGNQKTTTYNYKTEWTGMPANSSQFDTVQGHQNPSLSVQDTNTQVSTALIGKLPVEATSANFYGSTDLQIEETLLNKSTGKALTTDGKYIYMPYGITAPAPSYADPYGLSPPPTPQATRNPAMNPQVGDVRVYYSVFMDGQNGTVAGDWNGTLIAPHVYDKTALFLGVYPGSSEAFAAHLNLMHSAGTWGIRIGTFFMMWIGLGLIVGPITVLVQSLPLIGGAGKSVIGLVTGALAFVFWLFALLLAHTWVLIAMILILVGGVVLLIKSRKNPASV